MQNSKCEDLSNYGENTIKFRNFNFDTYVNVVG